VVWKVTGRGKGRFAIRGLLADTRCSQPVFDFLSTYVGRRVRPRLRTARRGGATALSLHAFLHGLCGRGVGVRGQFSFDFPVFLLPSPLLFLYCALLLLAQEGKGELATSRQRTGNGQCVSRHDLHRSHANNDKSKQKPPKISAVTLNRGQHSHSSMEGDRDRIGGNLWASRRH
jgi:hypothetical protein